MFVFERVVSIHKIHSWETWLPSFTLLTATACSLRSMWTWDRECTACSPGLFPPPPGRSDHSKACFSPRHSITLFWPIKSSWQRPSCLSSFAPLHNQSIPFSSSLISKLLFFISFLQLFSLFCLSLSHSYPSHRAYLQSPVERSLPTAAIPASLGLHTGASLQGATEADRPEIPAGQAWATDRDSWVGQGWLGSALPLLINLEDPPKQVWAEQLFSAKLVPKNQEKLHGYFCTCHFSTSANWMVSSQGLQNSSTA